ncbi:OLC1v1030248C1 [Oldenlandia corymbosa var. corymbosa]|uniref:OLC1v1030248C1 n=1 Tax=Oldenlandia corymbosa var. corymbosa TaxID=529605 RepID=A0AAV1CFP3_OLDCO|nr:OLC1v1030248C1 [Oldenlandia corymbosa var. corymbosa]
MFGPSGTYSRVYYDPSPMEAPAAETEGLDFSDNAHKQAWKDLDQEDSSSLQGTFYSLPSNFSDTDDLSPLDSSSQFRMPESFYAIPEDPLGEDMLSDASYIPHVFVPNIPDYPPYPKTSPNSVFNGIIFGSSDYEFSQDREPLGMLFLTPLLKSLLSSTPELIPPWDLEDASSRNLTLTGWDKDLQTVVPSQQRVVTKRAKNSRRTGKQPSQARMKVDSDDDMDSEASITSRKRASSDSEDDHDRSSKKAAKASRMRVAVDTYDK